MAPTDELERPEPNSPVASLQEVLSTYKTSIDTTVFDSPVDPRSGEPSHPVESKSWAEWAGFHMHGLWLAKCDAETKLAHEKYESAKKIADLKSEVHKLQALRDQHADHLRAVRTESKREVDEAREHMAEAEKINIEAAEAKIETKRIQSQSKTYHDFCESMKNLSATVTRATTELKILVENKKIPALAFEKWQKSYCQPLTQLVQLWSRVETARDEVKRERTKLSQKMAQCEKESLEKDAAYDKATQELKKEHEAHLAERKEWFETRIRECDEPEVEAAIQDCVDKRIESLKPYMLDEANRLAYHIAKQEWEAKTADEMKKAQDTSYYQGKEDGYAECRGNTEEERHAALAEAKQLREEGIQVYLDRLEAEFDRGKEIGREESRTQGYSLGSKASGVTSWANEW